MSDLSSDQGARWAARSLFRWRVAAALAAVVMLAALAWAPTKEFFRPWRAVQERYNSLAAARGLDPVPVQVRQTWFAEVGKADRCGTCHLAMTGAREIEGEPPFEGHPALPHAVEEYGCTFCHSGQGRATDAVDAHGEEGSWPHPILAAERTEAGCGTCHSGLALPLPEEVEDAPDLVESYGCLDCHDGDHASPLDGIALRGIPEQWIERHRGLAPASDDSEQLSAADPDEVLTLTRWLRTKTGAERLARGKMVFQQLGCMGCHRRGAIGGDVGPELSFIGDRDVRSLAEEGSSGPATMPQWLEAHLLDPQALAKDSRMPPVDVEELEQESDLDDLVTYLMSLRNEKIPARLVPPDRAREEYGLGRSFPTSGRGVFVTFCSACHGSWGGGAELEALGLVTPMIGTRGVLSMVTPRYFQATIHRGRRGRFMPAWGPEDGGLSEDEINAVVSYLFEQSSKIKPYASVRGPGDRKRGRQSYAKRCGHCHEPKGDQVRFGRDLLRRGALDAFTEEGLYLAIMNGWVEEGMPSFAFLRRQEIRDLMAFLDPGARRDAGRKSQSDGLHSYIGQSAWRGRCAECHGDQGEGGSGPMLNTVPYLAWADDGYLATRIRRHRSPKAKATIGTPSDEDLHAIIDYVRTWDGMAAPPVARVADEAAVERGRALYGPRCAECHGEDGYGKTGPGLANTDFLALVTRPFLAMTILEGRKGTPMRAWHMEKKNPVGVREAFDLADYLLSLGDLGAEPGAETTTSASGGTR